ncbi:MAG: MGH1-like glycoside hydrolase domain-containing protein [Sporichthyaceae bacterium]
MNIGSDPVRAAAARLLEDHWDETRGHTYPNRRTYPHQWLWDSCFASIAWAVVGRPDRGLREVGLALSAQFADGFVPHMRYAKANLERGPRSDVSSFTQPPVYAHALRVLAEAGGECPPDLLDRVGRAVDWLWTRRLHEGLVYVVHPWETGADDSPRWDSWVAEFVGGGRVPLRWRRRLWSRHDRHLVTVAEYDGEGEARWSREFVCAPAAFNALSAHAAFEYAELSGDASWTERGRELAALVDSRMWSVDTGLWSDVPVVGGGSSASLPTLDGVLPALVTDDAEKANRALDQVLDPRRFAAPYGLAYVAQDSPAFDPDGYWRGTAWMQLNYLVRLTALRWGRVDVADAVRTASRAGAQQAKFAEHWNPRSGKGRGAIPLTWSALVAAM